MNANNILEELQTLYPEDLNKDYNCYWWCTCNTDGSALTYYLQNKYMITIIMVRMRLIDLQVDHQLEV